MSGASSVLVIDDNERVALATCRLLKVMGCKATSCCDALQSLVVAQQLQPDAVLLDISMPGMTGLELVARIRRRIDAPCKIIAVTGHTDPGMQRQCAKAGFDAFCPKPIDISQLESILGL